MFKKLFALFVIGATLGVAAPVDDSPWGDVSPLEDRSLEGLDAEVSALVQRAAVEERASTGNKSITPYECGAHPSDKDFASAEAHFAKHKTESKDKSAIATINVYFHVIRAGPTVPQGDVPYASLVAQINVLNNLYAGSGLRFVLAGGERTTYAPWFSLAGPGSAAQTQMKNARRIGTGRDLNVYTVGFTNIGAPNLLGYATFPWSLAGAPKDDGILILHSSVPGGARYGYNSGKNLVHEVGHWVGLYHTFQGGCNGGDGVADTPAEASAEYYCTTNRNTCAAAGFDPIHNYMDYSGEACKNQFTSGQFTRLRAAVRLYRGIAV